MDVLATYEAVWPAVERARAGEGPTLVVAACYRFEGHPSATPRTTVAEDEAAAWHARDPVATFRAASWPPGLLDDSAADAIEVEEEAPIALAVEAAEAAPLPEPVGAWDRHLCRCPMTDRSPTDRLPRTRRIA